MQQLVDYAKRFLLTPYIFGGAHPAFGLDCSGLVQIILASIGMDPHGDQSAQALWDHFAKEGAEIWEPKVGALMFYGKDKDSITHIAFCVSAHQIIEAGGGGSNCTDLSKAIASEAFVRLRPIDHRKDLLGILYPSYPDWLTQLELPLG